LKTLRSHNGIPRVINVIAERALLGAYANGERKITRPLIRKAMAEVLGRGGKAKLNMPNYLLGTSLCTAILALMIAGVSIFRQDSVVAIETANATTVPTEGIVSAGAPTTNTQNGLITSVVEPASNDATADVNSNIVSAATPTETADFAAITEVSDLQSLLDQYGETKIAFGTLFNIWGLPSAVDNEQSSCLIAENNGLACIYETGDLEKLISYNRPAVLELFDDSGKKRTTSRLKGTSSWYAKSRRHVVSWKAR